jgi:DnaJ-class molecular chaperone
MEIKICSTCQGQGFIVVRDRQNFADEVNCDKCNGTGRLMVRTFTVEVPFGFNKSKLTTAYNTIFKTILDLRK